MKRILLILAVCLSLNGNTQELDSLVFTSAGSYPSIDTSDWDIPFYGAIYFGHIEEYIKSCKDTITAVACGNGEFTIRDKEIVTSEQMKRKGYDFYREYITLGDVFDIKYIFVKEPTLMGFYDWLKDE